LEQAKTTQRDEKARNVKSPYENRGGSVPEWHQRDDRALRPRPQLRHALRSPVIALNEQVEGEREKREASTEGIAQALLDNRNGKESNSNSVPTRRNKRVAKDRTRERYQTRSDRRTQARKEKEEKEQRNK